MSSIIFGVLVILKLLGIIELSWWGVFGIPIAWAFIAAGLNEIFY